MSHNIYSKFDVDQNGVILNNSKNSVRTQLGGTIAGNSALASGTAKVILNEVNSSNPSQLKGYIEVAGSKAEVVIANPSGITCNGCGFINVSRSTLTTGVANIDSEGNLTGYDVDKGKITIEGDGLNTKTQDYTDIIARSVEINSSIWAKDLKITTGRNTVDAKNAVVTQLSDDGSTAPELALDVKGLGGMYANQITLIGTESGVGVSNAGIISASAGSVNLAANGDIKNSGQIIGSGSVTLVGSNISNTGTISSNSTVLLQGSGNITNTSYIKANKGDVIVLVGADVNNSGDIYNTTGSSTKKGDIYLLGSGDVVNSGNISSAGAITLYGNNAKLTTGATAYSNTNTNITGYSSIANGGIVKANGTVTLASAVNNSGSIISNGGQAISITGKGIDNSGFIYNSAGSSSKKGDVELVSSGDLDNSGSISSAGSITLYGSNVNLTTGATVYSNANTSITGYDSVINDGIVQDNGTVTLASTGEVNNSGSLISNGRQAIPIKGKGINNSGFIYNVTGSWLKNGDIELISSDDINNSGSISSSGSINLTGANVTLALASTLDSNKDTHITATGDVVNKGTVKANGEVVVESAGEINNSGSILGNNGNAITLTGKSINNSGYIYNNVGSSSKSYNVTLVSSDDIVNTGEIYSKGNLILTSKNLENSGIISSGSVLTSTQSGDLDNSGTLQSTGNMTISSEGAFSNTSIVNSQKNLTITSASLNSTSDSMLYANSGNLTVTTSGALVANGTNYASNTLTMNGYSIDVSNSQTKAKTINFNAENGVVDISGANITKIASSSWWSWLFG